jgi:hypothetical protein
MIYQSPDEVIEWVALMRRLGIQKLGSIELFPARPSDSAPSTEKDLKDLDAGAPEGDDALFWSVAGPLPSEVRSADKPPEE